MLPRHTISMPRRFFSDADIDGGLMDGQCEDEFEKISFDLRGNEVVANAKLFDMMTV